MTLRLLSLFSMALLSFSHAEEYELGHGVSLNEYLNVGSYFSSVYESTQRNDTWMLDDVAVLAYGDINPMFSYLAEAEAVGFYSKNLTDGSEGGSKKFHAERVYGDIWMSDDFNLRFGKMITPIGYWNKEPINVLRDTSSNPLYSTLLFPRLLTGIDINGYVPTMEGMRYHLFGQNNRDLDEEYINIPNRHFYGLSLEQEFSMDLSGGASIGEYITKTDQHTHFLQVGTKYDDTKWQLTFEALLAKNTYSDGQDAYALSGYAQAMYHFVPEHALIGRYEYFNDHHTDYKDNIAILGYSYRPLYPVSLKGEYQWHSLNDENRALFSLSVLF